MRIEENIRDTKCSHYGLGLKKSLTRCHLRMNIIIVAAIVTLAAWIAGLFIQNIGIASDFQAHFAKIRSALSCVFLGEASFKQRVRYQLGTISKYIQLTLSRIFESTAIETSLWLNFVKISQGQAAVIRYVCIHGFWTVLSLKKI